MAKMPDPVGVPKRVTFTSYVCREDALDHGFQPSASVRGEDRHTYVPHEDGGGGDRQHLVAEQDPGRQPGRQVASCDQQASRASVSPTTRMELTFCPALNRP